MRCLSRKARAPGSLDANCACPVPPCKSCKTRERGNIACFGPWKGSITFSSYVAVPLQRPGCHLPAWLVTGFGPGRR